MAAHSNQDGAFVNCEQQHDADSTMVVDGRGMANDREIDINIAPAQDSPKHILNILNDDVLQEILRRVENVDDFLSAAEVCVRFQENAKSCFPKRFRDLKIYEWRSLLSNNQLSYHRAKNFLNIFGSLLEKIAWKRYRSYPSQNEPIFNAIADNCTKTLKVLHIYDHQGDLNAQLPFQTLEKLYVEGDTGLSGSNMYPQLNCLTLKWMIRSVEWIDGRFPEMQCVDFEHVHELKDTSLIELLKNSPKLRSFRLVECFLVTPTIFEHIDTRASGLEVVSFVQQYNENVNESDLMFLTGLRRLKRLTFRYRHRPEVKFRKLFAAFVKNEVPLEHLSLTIDPDDEEGTRESLSQLKLLKSLKLSSISDETLLHFVKNLPVLEKIYIGHGYGITLYGIQQVLQIGRNLKWIRLKDIDFTLDWDAYNSILAIARGRIHVELVIGWGIPIPDEIEWHSEWITVEYDNEEFYEW